MAKEHYGYAISHGDNYVVREKILSDGTVEIRVHSKTDQEHRPLGYVLGSNMLAWKPPVR